MGFGYRSLTKLISLYSQHVVAVPIGVIQEFSPTLNPKPHQLDKNREHFIGTWGYKVFKDGALNRKPYNLGCC